MGIHYGSMSFQIVRHKDLPSTHRFAGRVASGPIVRLNTKMGCLYFNKLITEIFHNRRLAQVEFDEDTKDFIITSIDPGHLPHGFDEDDFFPIKVQEKNKREISSSLAVKRLLPFIGMENTVKGLCDIIAFDPKKHSLTIHLPAEEELSRTA